MGSRSPEGFLFVLAGGRAVRILALLAAAGCGSADSVSQPGNGGARSTGGSTGTGGSSSGGRTGSGGSVGPAGTGGASSGSGGVSASGGGTATGGSGNGGNGTATGGRGGGSEGPLGGAGGSSIVTGGGGGGTAAPGGAGGGSTPTGGAAGGSVTECTTNDIARCTGTKPIACHLMGTPGNYEVTVDVGGAAAGDTYVEAEAFRRMVARTTTAAGQTKRFSFVVNVRANENEPVRPNDSPTDVNTPGIPGLDIYFSGTAPQASFLCHKLAPQRPVMIWLAGDSTVTDQQFIAYSGWGQHLPQHFLPPISVANYGNSGESSSSFLANPGLWPVVKAGLRAGDWAFVQFGHNDTSDTALRTNLGTYIKDAKAASAFPVLVSPPARALFTGTTLDQQHGNFPAIFREVALANNVPLVDLTAITSDWLRMLGPNGWQIYFANGSDRTHCNHAGADIISGFVRDAVRQQIPELSKYLR